MKKRGQKVLLFASKFKTRWMVLRRSGRLSWYASRSDTEDEEKGHILLSKDYSVKLSKELNIKVSARLASGLRTLYLLAETRETRDRWVGAFRTIIDGQEVADEKEKLDKETREHRKTLRRTKVGEMFESSTFGQKREAFKVQAEGSMLLHWTTLVAEVELKTSAYQAKRYVASVDHGQLFVKHAVDAEQTKTEEDEKDDGVFSEDLTPSCAMLPLSSLVDLAISPVKACDLKLSVLSHSFIKFEHELVMMSTDLVPSTTTPPLPEDTEGTSAVSVDHIVLSFDDERVCEEWSVVLNHLNLAWSTSIGRWTNKHITDVVKQAMQPYEGHERFLVTDEIEFRFELETAFIRMSMEVHTSNTPSCLRSFVIAFHKEGSKDDEEAWMKYLRVNVTKPNPAALMKRRSMVQISTKEGYRYNEDEGGTEPVADTEDEVMWKRVHVHNEDAVVEHLLPEVNEVESKRWKICDITAAGRAQYVRVRRTRMYFDWEEVGHVE